MSAVARPAAGPAHPLERGWLGFVASTDHKRVAARVALTAALFFVAAGALALVIRLELAAPGLQVTTPDAYSQLFTMHGSGMVYLVVTPIGLALGLYFVPLQVGASELSRPRLAHAGSWLYLLGGLVMFSGFLAENGAGKATWVGTDPLSETPWTQGAGQDLWMVGVMLAVGGVLLLAGCILGTLLRRRAPGMTLLRMPVFCWAMFVTCLMAVVGFPALELALALQLAERNFEWAEGALAALPYQHLFWFYGHPVVYVMFFPFLGAVGEVVATFSRRRFFGYRALVLSLLAFSGLSMAVWGHHMLATGRVETNFFSLTSTVLVIPAGIDYFDMVATMWAGSVLLRVPMLFAIGFLLQFLVGGLTGIWLASPPLDYHVHDTYYVVAHFHYTLFAGSLFGLFAGVYYWWPKVTGVRLRDGLGKLHFWSLVVGANLTFFPMFLLGNDGMTRRIYDYPEGRGWELGNVLATAGAFVIALSVLVFAANVVVSLHRRRPAGDDPWGGQTLEWWTSSPPPRHNFDRPLPPVRSFAPLQDLREAEEGAGARA